MENQEAKAEVKTAEKKSGSSLKFILVLFVLAFLAAGGFWAYQQAEKYFTKNPVTPPLANKVAKPAVAQPEEEIALELETPEVVVSLLPPLVADANEVPNPALSPELSSLPAPAPAVQQQDNKIFILYIAARDLRDSVSTPERFKKELSFTRVTGLEYPELQSKMELLEIASNNGIPTKESLLAELAMLQEKMRNRNHGSFVANVQNSLSKLIVVSKIEGEVSSNDYNSIIKRAEIAIEHNDLAKASKELAVLAPDSKDILDKINNLRSVREITEYIVDFAKAKIASQGNRNNQVVSE